VADYADELLGGVERRRVAEGRSEAEQTLALFEQALRREPLPRQIEQRLIGLETGSIRVAKQVMPSKGVPFPIEEWPSVVIRGLEVLNRNNWFPPMTLIIGDTPEKPLTTCAPRWT
jgi:hypothetical protein